MKTTPMRHQAAEHETHCDAPARALWWDPGTGKTKVSLDLACYLHQQGRITGLLVVAPGGVHRAWANDELPLHAWTPYEVFVWSSERSGLKSYKRELETFTAATGPSLRVLCMTYDGLMTAYGAKCVKRFLEVHKCLYVADETGRIKNPGAKTTKRVLASAKYAPFRRALNGTPVSDSPFQAYSQVRFIDQEAWAPLGIKDYTTFKGYFGVWAQVRTAGGAVYPKLVGYQNLEQLTAVLQRVGTRVRKEDCMDLPPKQYVKRYFPLSTEERSVYDRLRDDFRVQMNDGALTAENKLTWLTRLQQAASGRLPTDDDQQLRLIGTQPWPSRADALPSVLEEFPGQAIIWAKFTFEIEDIIRVLQHEEISYVRYDGEVGADDREEAKRKFQAGEARCFVAKASSAGYGLTLTAAGTVIYVSNPFSLDDRQQSEDRAHRKGQTKTVTYVDLLAEDTVDEKILTALRTKREVAVMVNGDELRSWI